MTFRIGRTLPPAATPISIKDIVAGVASHFQGEKAIKRFEEQLKDYYQVGHCFTVSSGKTALALILQSLHELSPERDEVLIPAYTCYSVPSAIVRAGLRVRSCDVSKATLDFDYERLAEELDNPRLLAVVPTHLFGLPANVERIKDMVRGRGIFVVEDAAQAMGAEWNGRRLGAQGDVGLFSMGRGKAFSTVEGGVILTDDDKIGRAIGKRLETVDSYGMLDSLKLFLYALALTILIHPLLYWLPKSLPFLKLGETCFDPDFPVRKLSAFQAGLAKGWQKRIAALREIRANNAAKLSGYGVLPMGFPGDGLPDLIRFPFLCRDTEGKRRILETSGKKGLGIADGYPDSIDGIAELVFRTDRKGYPAAKEIAERLVTLPVHPFLRESDIEKIVILLKS